MAVSRKTLQLFEELLGSVQLQAAHPDFEEKALQVVNAKKEIAEALEEAESSA